LSHIYAFNVCCKNNKIPRLFSSRTNRARQPNQGGGLWWPAHPGRLSLALLLAFGSGNRNKTSSIYQERDRYAPRV
jgi:hypothetical protein